MDQIQDNVYTQPTILDVQQTQPKDAQDSNVKDKSDDAEDVKRIVERLRESQDWMNTNYYKEFTDVHLASKVKAKPITYKDGSGKEVEDKTRTNVCMPDIAALINRNTARMTAEPPSVRFICQDNQDLAERLTAWAMFQFDRSGEAKVQRLHVKQAETFGVSYTKLYWDKMVQNRTFRQQRANVTSRAAHMEEAGATPPEIQQAIAQLGPDMSPEEMAMSIAENGPEMLKQVPLKKYEGPVVKFVFIGDLFIEPGVKSLNDSSWVIEKYIDNDNWLTMMDGLTYTDKYSGGEIKVFDSEAVKELREMDPEVPNRANRTYYNDLRNQLRDAVGISEPRIKKELLRGKRYEVLECHEVREDGRIWITWIGNETVKLGEMPYIFDLGGRYVYTEYIPMPDLIFAVGDSTPRLGRFLHQLHNVVVNQRTDLVNNLLRRVVFRRHGADIPDEAIERAAFRIFDVKDPNDFVVQPEPDVPASAWESEAAIMRQMALLDGILNNVEAGSSLNPQAGKTATTAVLQQRAVDAMTASKLDCLNQYVKEVTEKKLMMLQQQLQEVLQMPLHFSQSEALSQRYGPTRAICIDPFEIQEDIGVEPEAGSTLAVDDEFRRMAATQLYQLAEADPATWNKNEAAKLVASTVKGADATKLVNPPTPPPTPPPKGAINLAIKFTDLPPDTQQAILQQMGLPPSQMIQNEIQMAPSKQIMQHMAHVSQAADHADNMLGAGEQEKQAAQAAQQAQQAKPPSGPGGRPADEPVKRTMADQA